MSKIRIKIMSAQIRSKKIVACLVALGIVGAIGIGASKAEAQMLTPTAAVRFGAANQTGSIIAMDAITTAYGKTYLAVLEQRNVWQDFPQEPPGDLSLELSSADTDSADTETAAGACGGYKDIRVLRVLDVTADEWVGLFLIEYDEPDWPTAVEFIGLSDRPLVAALMTDRIEYYNPEGTEGGETALPVEVDGYPVTVYNAFDVAYIDGDIDSQPRMFVVGSAMNADGIPCVACVAPDGTGGFMVDWKKTYPEFVGEAFTRVSATTDGTSAVLVCLGQAAQNVRNRILEIRYANGENCSTVRSLLTSEDPLTEFVDVAGDRNPFMASPMYYALANEETPEGGTKAVLYYYWHVDEFTPAYTGNLCIAEPCEPEGHVVGKCLRRGADIWGSSDEFQYVYLAGNTDVPILGGPPSVGGSDVWVAAVQFDITGFDVDYISPVLRYGGAGDDTLGAMAVTTMPGFEKTIKALKVYVGMNTDSRFEAVFGACTTQSVGGTGTDPTIVELKTPAGMIAELIAKVEAMNLHQGIENSLDVKLENGVKSLESVKAGDRQDAANKLQAFVNECVAQTGKKLTMEQADELITDADAIIAVLQLR